MKARNDEQAIFCLKKLFRGFSNRINIIYLNFPNLIDKTFFFLKTEKLESF